MSALMEALHRLDELIEEKSPYLARRLQVGLTRTELVFKLDKTCLTK